MGGERTDLREVMVKRLVAAVEEGVNVAVLVSDSTSTASIGPFAAKFPERLVNVGIAEQNLLGVAAGMARGGYVAVTANAAPFVVGRANEQLKNDVCYSEANVKVAALNAGFAYANLGSTHHAIDDISIVRGMGNILIFAPSDPVECDGIFRFALAHVGPVYIRMDNLKFPSLHAPSYRFVPGAVDVLREGADVTVFAVGSVVYEAAAAAEALAAEGISVHLANVPSIRPLDRDAVAEAAAKTGRLITVEEHSLHGGLGSLVCEIVAERGMAIRVRRLGIPEGSFAKAGPRAEMRRFYGIDAAGIAAAAREVAGAPARAVSHEASRG
jgi:transketolase